MTDTDYALMCIEEDAREAGDRSDAKVILALAAVARAAEPIIAIANHIDSRMHPPMPDSQHVSVSYGDLRKLMEAHRGLAELAR